MPQRRIKKLVDLLRTAASLKQPVRFLAWEALLRSRTAFARATVLSDYETRPTGNRIVVEHGTPDPDVLREIFVDRLYEMPDAVRAALPRCGINVVDLGGNVGYFAVWANANLDVARLIAYEPDYHNIYRYQDAVSKLNRPEWSCVLGYASASGGTIGFQMGHHAIGTSTDEGTGVSVPMIDVLPVLHDAHLVKMDIEGGEWAILSDPRLASINANAIVLEYHPFGCPVADPRGHALRCVRDAGFQVEPIFHDATRGVGMLWGYRTKASDG